MKTKEDIETASEDNISLQIENENLISKYYSSTTTHISNICRYSAYAMIIAFWGILISENSSILFGNYVYIDLILVCLYLVLDVSQYVYSTSKYYLLFYRNKYVENASVVSNEMEIVGKRSWQLFIFKILYLLIIMIIIALQLIIFFINK